MRASLSAEEARALALRAQHVGDPTLIEAIDTVDRLGAIQLDSVNILARAHLLTPFARVGPYSVDELHTQIYERKRGFEYWGHVASWMPIAEYRYFLPRMRRYRDTGHPWWRDLRDQHAAMYPAVLDRVRAEGPLGAAAFEDPRGRAGTWWDWKPAKLVLEDLFRQGVLMCADRTPGFARLYDLAERVLPAGLDLTDPGQPEATRYLLKRGLAALGVATAQEMADYFRLIPVEGPREALKGLVADEEIVQIKVEGWAKSAYVLADTLDAQASIPSHRPTFVAPFDNLMWERSRVERIFGFHYRIEIYTPGPKRQYGYYVMPLLAHGTFCGRADLKLDRAGSVLQVKGLWLQGAEPEEAQEAIETLARHLGASDIDLPG
jgi:uncharacterized protein YcaQ